MGVKVQAIKPSKPFNPAPFRKRYLEGMKKWGKLVEEDFEKTTATWKTDVDFDNETTEVQGLGIETEVSTDNEIYHYVNDGTEPHAIFAGVYTGKSNKKSLKFKSEFVPKTKKGFIGSTGGSRGGDTVHTPYVQHPGSEGRLFNVAIKGKREKDLVKIMNQATSLANKESGYSME